MVKEKVHKPKCKGVWKSRFLNGMFCYQCTKCGKEISPQQGREAVDHIRST